MGRTIPDLKLSLQLRRHVCIELGYPDPRIVLRVRPLPGVSRTCAVTRNRGCICDAGREKERGGERREAGRKGRRAGGSELGDKVGMEA